MYLRGTHSVHYTRVFPRTAVLLLDASAASARSQIERCHDAEQATQHVPVRDVNFSDTSGDAMSAELAAVDDLVASKTASLEAELVFADNTLARVQSELEAVCTEVGALPDDALEIASPALTARIHALFSSLKGTVPMGPQTPADIAVVVSSERVSTAGKDTRVRCEVVGVSCPDARGLQIVSGDDWHGCSVLAGSLFTFELGVRCASAEGGENSVDPATQIAYSAAMCRLARVAAVLSPLGAAPIVCPVASIRPSSTTGCIAITVAVPPSASVGDRVVVNSVAIGSAKASGFPMELRVANVASLRSGTRLTGAATVGSSAQSVSTPCVSSAGRIYAPLQGEGVILVRSTHSGTVQVEATALSIHERFTSSVREGLGSQWHTAQPHRCRSSSA
jgi:hypothetical protein